MGCSNKSESTDVSKWESDDPWYQEEDISDIFSSAEGFSFEGQAVCLTGDFEFGKKSAVTAFIEEHGGSCVSSVTRKTTVLLVGNKGSEAWSHGNYGSKVERALELQREGCTIRIFRETDVLAVSSGTNARKTGTSGSKPKSSPLLNQRKIEALANRFDVYRFMGLVPYPCAVSSILVSSIIFIAFRFRIFVLVDLFTFLW